MELSKCGDGARDGKFGDHTLKMSSTFSSPELKVAVCQLTSVDDYRINEKAILKLLEKLEGDVPDLVCFPENALYLRLREDTPIPSIDVNSEALQAISRWAVRFQSVVHIGSVPLRKDGRVYNSSIALTPEGEVHDNYQKIHLFDVDVVGEKRMRESDTFTHGSEPSVFTVKGWKFGSSICYDLRFSELYLHYAKLGVDAILVPAAFLMATGRAHWEILLRARAIECQAYLLAAAQGGEHQGVQGGSRKTYGHSLIVDPWGEVMALCPEDFRDEDRILRAVLKRDVIERVRMQIPIKNHRRL